MSPYLIQGPALISFSGGRTSGYMLKHILDARGGKLPPDVHVAFANTGKEREETLRFVHECGSRWGVRIHWLEWRSEAPGFAEVGFNSAARDGEPFAALIAKKGYLPNAVTRFCTMELKVRAMRDFAKSLGWTSWLNVVGLRYDEGHRVLKGLARNDTGKEPWTSVFPMSRAKATKRDVSAFWATQPFDLGLQSYEGNCDLCMLKSRGALKRLIRDNPSMADWWKAQEASITARAGRGEDRPGRQFVTEYSYADLEREVARSPFMPGLLDDEHDVECGLLCAPMEAA